MFRNSPKTRTLALLLCSLPLGATAQTVTIGDAGVTHFSL